MNTRQNFITDFLNMARNRYGYVTHYKPNIGMCLRKTYELHLFDVLPPGEESRCPIREKNSSFGQRFHLSIWGWLLLYPFLVCSDTLHNLYKVWSCLFFVSFVLYWFYQIALSITMRYIDSLLMASTTRRHHVIVLFENHIFVIVKVQQTYRV